MTPHSDRQRIETELSLLLSSPPGMSDEVRSSLARYVCVLASSLLEASIREMLNEYCRPRASDEVLRYVNSTLRFFRDPNTEKILVMLARLDPGVREAVEERLTDRQKDGVDSISAQRNSISHGRSSGISMAQVMKYCSEARSFLSLVHRELLWT